MKHITAVTRAASRVTPGDGRHFIRPTPEPGEATHTHGDIMIHTPLHYGLIILLFTG